MKKLNLFLATLFVTSVAVSYGSNLIDESKYPKVDPKSGIELPKRSAQVVNITTLADMQEYMKQDGVHVVLKKGDYYISERDLLAGKFPATAEVVENRTTHALFMVRGDGSTYDFGGSTIHIEAKKIFKSKYLKGELSDLHVLGNGNVVTGVSFIEHADVDDFPARGCTNVIIDGRQNIVDNVNVQSIGSLPYGYGDIFGKGGGPVIKHRKHCAVLVRGDDNTYQNSKIFHNAFGHCLFMQGAVRPNIINNNISSRMTTTEAILAEKGDVNSKANQVNFKTCWKYPMTKQLYYTKAVCEAGIRAYNSGNTMIDGVRYRRKAVDGSYIAGNFVKDTRVGVTLTHSTNTTRRTLVEDCITLGTERGYAVNNDAVIRRCSSDAKYGPAFGVDYKNARNNIVDITIIDSQSDDYIISHYDGKKYRTSNGEAHIAYIQGSGHQIKFREGRVKDIDKEIYTKCADKNIKFCAFDLGGNFRLIANIWKANADGTRKPGVINDDNPTSLVNTYLANETNLPIRVHANAKNNHIWSVGEVIEQQAGNNTVVRGKDWNINEVFGK